MAGLMMGNYMVSAPTAAPETSPAAASTPSTPLSTGVPVAGTTAASGLTLGGYAVVAPSPAVEPVTTPKTPVVFSIRGLATSKQTLAGNSVASAPQSEAEPVITIPEQPVMEVVPTVSTTRPAQPFVSYELSRPAFIAPDPPIQPGFFYRPGVNNSQMPIHSPAFYGYGPGWSSTGYTPLDWTTGRRANEPFHCIYPSRPRRWLPPKKKAPTAYGLEQVRIASLPILPSDPYADPVREPEKPRLALSAVIYAIFWLLFQLVALFTVPVLDLVWNHVLPPFFYFTRRIIFSLRRHFSKFLFVYIMAFFILLWIVEMVFMSKDDGHTSVPNDKPLYIIYLGRRRGG